VLGEVLLEAGTLGARALPVQQEDEALSRRQLEQIRAEQREVPAELAEVAAQEPSPSNPTRAPSTKTALGSTRTCLTTSGSNPRITMLRGPGSTPGSERETNRLPSVKLATRRKPLR
jgi:hypothetical protein